ncbi:MAG: NAD(P)/FAD-dependent oxidoreductase [Halosimplex sp.]
MDDRLSYDVVVVGGGPAGTTAALYATRLGHRTALFEKEGGRHAAVSHVHNLYGVSEDVSGRELSAHAVAQLEEYGADYYLDPVTALLQEGTDTADARFTVEAEQTTVTAERVVLATGFTDREPSVPDLREFTGRGLHYCLHCDGYGLGDSPAYVLGHGDHAARVAMILLNFTDDIDLLLDDRDPVWSDATERQLRAHPVDRVDTEVVGAFADGEDGGERAGERSEPWLGGLEFADGTDREYRGGFAMYGKEYNTALAEDLGCSLADDGAVAVDERFETSVDGLYAVGDLTHGQNQTVVAMGDGAKAGMAIHKDLRLFPRPPGEDVDESAVPAAPADVRSRMRLVRGHDDHPGLREPGPRR